ncbi:ABC transporter permease [Mesorhizobium comanense]|jgi:ribose/xylose/arabinose/galactoside ABC-type transport system permease subunit|uniref:ABC transporter permease n=1 Tax=Mesorhizobium comanense TaxID=2502215 RepID=UPI0010F66F0F|nr:ABC transporter permease [Mesorhizobium comanense]
MTNTETTQSAPRPSMSMAGKATIDVALRLGGLFAAIVVVALIFIAINPNVANLNMGGSVLRSMSSVAIMALGLTLVIVVGEIDLSFGAIYGLAINSLAVMWIVHGIPVYFAMPLAILVGALVGLFNGMLVTQLKIPSFIVTLGSYNLLYGVTLWVSNTGTFNPAYPPAGKTVPKGELDFFVGLTQSIGSFQLSIEVIWMIAIAIVVGLLLHRSLFGFRLMAIGGNPVAASLARLPVRSYKVMAFVLCGVLAAVAGVLDFSFIQTSQPNTGLSATFPVFAAVIIGGASLSGGKGTVIGTLGGALLLAELQLGLSILSPGAYVQQIFLGAVTIGAVALDLFLTKLRKSRSS